MQKAGKNENGRVASHGSVSYPILSLNDTSLKLSKSIKMADKLSYNTCMRKY